MPSPLFNKRYVFIISIASAMGGYLFGFDFAVITGGLPFLRDQFALDPAMEGFTTGSLALGCVVGCLLAGAVAERYGRKPGLMTAAGIFAFSSLGMAMAPGFNTFIMARFIAGIGVGMASMLSPIYIAEIAPQSMRGRLVAINQLTIVIGQVITHVENFGLRESGPEAWRWMFGLGFIPSILFLTGVFILPESPRWLMRKGREHEASIILNRIGSGEYSQQTILAIRESLHTDKKIRYKDLLHTSLLTLILIGVGLAVFQQFCGINVVFNYTTNIFRSIGATTHEQLLQAIYISFVNLIFTLVAMVLVDRWGRKPLMLMGAGGLAILYLIIGYLLKIKSGNVLAPFILLAIGTYAVSLAPVTWVLIAEIFPNRFRELATSVAVVSLWLAYFILVSTFPVIESKYGDSTAFWAYSVICTGGFFFILFKIKETKMRSLEEIEAGSSIQ